MSVAGFDIGNAASCVAVARKGGIDVLLNKESKRETPSCVSFSSKQRFLGTDASTFLSTNPKNTITQLKRLVGRQWGDAELQRDIGLLPFTIKEGPNATVLVQVQYQDKPAEFTPERLIAMMLVDKKAIAEAETKGPITDCVISCPSFFTEAERYAMMSAAQVAGLNCLRIMNETTAIALAYGIYKTDLPDTNPIHVAFIDFSHSSYQASIVALKKGQLQVLAHTWDRNFGGRDFDEVLFTHFAAEVQEKYKKDITTNPKASFRMRLACEKLKKVLSANSEAPINVECLIDDIDFQSSMTREKFEELAASLVERAKAPLAQAMELSGITLDAISSVELVGGSSRIPSVLRVLKDYFGHEPSRTLNAKEAVSRGCALQCAMLSPIFRVREFEVIDVFPYGVTVSWEKDGETVTSPLFERGCAVPSAKMLTFFRSQPFTVSVQYADDAPLPEGFDRRIGTFDIGPIKLAPGQDKAKLKVKVKLNLHSIVSLESVQQIDEADVEEPVTETPAPEASEAAPEAMAEDGAEAPAPANGEAPSADAPADAPMETDAPEAPKEPLKAAKKKKVTKADVPFAAHTAAPTPERLQGMFEAECELALQAKVQEETNERKNALEAYVYSLRNKLYDAWAPYVKEDDRARIVKQTEDLEEWLYDEGEDQPKSVYVAKLEELHTVGDPIQQRYQDDQTRSSAAAALADECARFLAVANSQDATHAHLTDEDRAAVRGECDKALKWLQEKQELQGQVAKTEPAVLSTEEIKKKQDVVARVCNPVVTKPAPAPPKVEEPKPMDTDAAAEEPAAEAAQGEAGEAQEEEEAMAE